MQGRRQTGCGHTPGDAFHRTITPFQYHCHPATVCWTANSFHISFEVVQQTRLAPSLCSKCRLWQPLQPPSVILMTMTAHLIRWGVWFWGVEVLMERGPVYLLIPFLGSPAARDGIYLLARLIAHRLKCRAACMTCRTSTPGQNGVVGYYKGSINPCRDQLRIE